MFFIGKEKSDRPIKNTYQNIQVSVRCRPMNSKEKKQGSCSILSCDPIKKEVTVKERTGVHPFMKTYTFDHVFPPDSEQIDVYKSVVMPVVEEVLDGYNCTIFAYGQTGSGKTFTMEGERTEQDRCSGIIPRAMHQIFDNLQIQNDIKYSVQVSFLEIYNEELYDLLGSTVDPLKLRIYENNDKKGSVIISGLEEMAIQNINEVYEILERATAKRSTASTLMNAVSSRSHSVFSVTIHIKENTVDEEELLKTGKLYLVDLAGSENIARSGAVDKRAREAGNINQSLLTLGRVITSLIEHAPHVPYRESKLTRLLQDSLGGRTKTSIIATISPASSSLEETLSTLDYAFRARNITNRPKINKKLTKKAVIRKYDIEIESLRRDLQACREKNGIYVAEENYSAIQNKISQQEEIIQEMVEKIQCLKREKKNLSELFTNAEEELKITSENLAETAKNLQETTKTLINTTEELCNTKQDRDEHKFLLEERTKTEKILFSQAKDLLQTAEASISDVGGLHDKIDRKKAVEYYYGQEASIFRKDLQNMLNIIPDMIKKVRFEANEINNNACNKIDELAQQHKDEVDATKQNLKNFLDGIENELQKNIQQHNIQCSTQVDWGNTTLENCAKMQETGRKICQTMLTELSESLTAQKNDYLEQSHILSESSKLLWQKKENMYLAVTKCQTEVILQLSKILAKSNNHLAELSLQNAELRENLKYAESNELDLDKKITELFFLRRHEHTEMLRKTQAHLERHQHSNTSLMLDLKHKGTEFNNLIEDRMGALKEQVHACAQESCSTIEMASKLLSSRNKDFDFTPTSNKITDAAEQNNKCVDEGYEKLEKRIAHLKQISENFNSKQLQKIEQIRTLCQNHTATVSTYYDEASNQFLENIDRSSTLHETITSTLNNGLQMPHEELDLTIRKVGNFFTKKLMKDNSTGHTPQRCEFKYPQKLVKTDEDDILLETFRSSKGSSDPLTVSLERQLDASAEDAGPGSSQASHGIKYKGEHCLNVEEKKPRNMSSGGRGMSRGGGMGRQGLGKSSGPPYGNHGGPRGRGNLKDSSGFNSQDMRGSSNLAPRGGMSQGRR